jgi:GAF domain-containing protein
MNEDRLRAAVAAGVLSADEMHRSLLQSIVEVARAIFHARASSIMLLDEEADELVFEAVAGEGSANLVGTRFPSGTGIGGWVLTSRQPIVIDDVTKDPRFSRQAAESTGYVPKGMMVVPLLNQDRALGVLYVLDRPANSRFSLQEVDLLGLFANQAAIGLDLLQRSRRAKRAVDDADSDAALVARVASAIEDIAPEDRQPVVRLLEALDAVVRIRPGP